MTEGMLRSTAHEVLLSEQGPQPTRGDLDPGGLGQIGAETRGGPDIKPQAQLGRQARDSLLQGVAVGRIRARGPASPWVIGESCDSLRSIAVQPIPHRPR